MFLLPHMIENFDRKLANHAGVQPVLCVLCLAQMSDAAAVHSISVEDIMKNTMCVKYRFILSVSTLYSFNCDECHSRRH